MIGFFCFSRVVADVIAEWGAPGSSFLLSHLAGDGGFELC